MFPIRMTSIEKYHFFDDSPAFPNQFFARFEFAGQIAAGPLQEAFELAVSRHVRGQAVARKSWGRWEWREREMPGTRIEFCETDDFRFRRLDLRTEPGYYAKCHVGPERTAVMMQVHHALTDGLGGLAFVRDWLVIYDNLIRGRVADAGLRQLQPTALLRRNRIGVASWRYLRHWWRQPIALFGAAKFIGRRFQTLVSEIDVPPADQWRPVSCGFSIDRESVQALKKTLVAQQVTLNDFLLATLYVALAKYFAAAETAIRTTCYRVIVPISIRERWESSMPTANRTTLVQLDRFARETGDIWGLARGIHFELGIIRHWMLDRIFLLAIRLMSISNHWLRYSAASPRPRGTTLLTNLGKPFVRSGLNMADGKVLVGDAALASVALLPPVRRHLPISCAAMQFLGDLNVTAHVDTRVIELERAERLMLSWEEAIRRAIP